MSSAHSSLQSPAPSALWRSFSPSHSSGNPQPWSNPALPLMVKEAGEKPTAMLIGPALNLWPLTSNRHLKVLPGNLTTFPSSCAVKLAQKITVSYLLLSLPTSNIASTFTSSGSPVCGHVIKVREAEGRERAPEHLGPHTLPSLLWLAPPGSAVNGWRRGSSSLFTPAPPSAWKTGKPPPWSHGTHSPSLPSGSPVSEVSPAPIEISTPIPNPSNPATSILRTPT